MPSRGTVELLLLTGPDAATFVQSQVCSDAAALAPGQWQFSAWLGPQGRVRCFFHLLRTQADHYVLALRGGNAETLAAALRRYVMRAKVTIATGSAVLTCETQAPAAPAAAAATRPLDKVDADWLLHGGDLPLQWRLSMESESGPADDAAIALEVDAGVPWLPPERLDDLLPAALDFERLGAISYKKGCYPGQEVAARIYFRGGNTRRLARVIASVPAAAGVALRGAGGEEAGCLLQVAESGAGLAVLRGEMAAPGTRLVGPEAATSIEVISAQWRADT